MLKVKKAKALKMSGKQKASHPVDKTEAVLLKAGVKEAKSPSSRTYKLVAHFLKVAPVAGKVYKAAELLKGSTSSLPNFVGATTRTNTLKVFKQFKKIVADSFFGGKKNKFATFHFVK